MFPVDSTVITDQISLSSVAYESRYIFFWQIGSTEWVEENLGNLGAKAVGT